MAEFALPNMLRVSGAIQGRASAPKTDQNVYGYLLKLGELKRFGVSWLPRECRSLLNLVASGCSNSYKIDYSRVTVQALVLTSKWYSKLDGFRRSGHSTTTILPSSIESHPKPFVILSLASQFCALARK